MHLCSAVRQPVLILLVCVLALVSLAGCARQVAGEQEDRVKVVVQAVSSSAGTPTHWTGLVRSHQQTKLSFTTAGRVMAVRVEVGDAVEAGAVLAELDPEPFQLSLKQAEAELLGAKPQLEEATRRKASEERLWAQNATSRVDYDAAQSAHAAASARVLAAESAVALATRQLREARLVAPCAGWIAQRLCHVAAWADIGAAAFEFDPSGEAEVTLSLPDSCSARVRVGDAVTLGVADANGGDSSIIGKVANIGRHSLAGGVREVIVRLPQDAAAHPGQSVTASLLGASETNPKLLVPVGALVPEALAGNGHVFVYDKGSGQLRERAVVYGEPVDQRIVIERGLAAGEFVVVAGASFLRDGQKADAQVR